MGMAWLKIDRRFLAKILVPEGSKDVPVGQPIAITVTCDNPHIIYFCSSIFTEKVKGLKTGIYFLLLGYVQQ